MTAEQKQAVEEFRKNGNFNVSLIKPEHLPFLQLLKKEAQGAGIPVLFSDELAPSESKARADLRKIRDIERALERLLTGEYGICVGCGLGIAENRLNARPYANKCLECASPATQRSESTFGLQITPLGA